MKFDNSTITAVS